MSREELENAGYESLTFEYVLPQEAWMLRNAIRQLVKGKRDYKLLEGEHTAEIFVRKLINQ